MFNTIKRAITPVAKAAGNVAVGIPCLAMYVVTKAAEAVVDGTVAVAKGAADTYKAAKADDGVKPLFDEARMATTDENVEAFNIIEDAYYGGHISLSDAVFNLLKMGLIKL